MPDNHSDDAGRDTGSRFADAISDYFQNQETPDDDENFAEMLENFEAETDQALQIGDKISGEIISVGMDAVFVNAGAKIDGVVDKAELLDDDGNLPFQPGDVVELYVVGVAEDEIRLSKAISGVGGLNMLREAHESGTPVEGKVKSAVKGGFQVEILQRNAFCPISQMDLKYVENPEEYVGQALSFLVNRIEENGRNVVVTRRELLAREQAAAQKEFMETIEVGAVCDGRVMRLMPYGAFIEIFPGVEGMAHVSEVSWSRVEAPGDVLREGEAVKVKILSMETENGKLKLSLSVKQASENPWDADDMDFRAGQKCKGRVTRCMPFGAFVEIAPGIEGLVHISEMSYVKRVLKPEELVRPGDEVDVMVKEVDADKRRIALSMKDAEGDPWIDVEKKYAAGQAVGGTLESKAKFGYFVTLEPGVTGLLPMSEVRKSSRQAAIEKLKEGDPLPAVVKDVNRADRKITLTPGDPKDEDDWKKYSSEGSGGLGSLGEKLKAAMKQKK